MVAEVCLETCELMATVGVDVCISAAYTPMCKVEVAHHQGARGAYPILSTYVRMPKHKGRKPVNYIT